MKVMIIPSILALLLLAGAAVSEDVATLRAGGQQAVDELYAKGGDDALLDRVCAQKDCRASRLYWYTDLDEAKAAAQRVGRPIVALHMLGRLDEDLSCANSRFFRTILYSDPAIAALLRENFVLYWHSVRPVPQVTVDFGDGRKMRQTITGNSAHFLLDAEGRPMDVLPGLYSPNEFREHLERWSKLDRASLREYHDDRYSETVGRWMNLQSIMPVADRPRSRRGEKPDARTAGALATSKSAIEMPVLAQMEIGGSLRAVKPAEWDFIGGVESRRVMLSAEAVELIWRKQFGGREPSAQEMRALLDNLRRSVASDTVFNECELHREIHTWFLQDEVTTLDALSARIYDELFLTPGDDPWLGLKKPSVFTALGG